MFYIQNIKGSCEEAMFGPKNTMFILKILIPPVYNYFDIKYSGLSPIYPNVTLRS